MRIETTAFNYFQNITYCGITERSLIIFSLDHVRLFLVLLREMFALLVSRIITKDLHTTSVHALT